MRVGAFALSSNDGRQCHLISAASRGKLSAVRVFCPGDRDAEPLRSSSDLACQGARGALIHRVVPPWGCGCSKLRSTTDAHNPGTAQFRNVSGAFTPFCGASCWREQPDHAHRYTPGRGSHLNVSVPRLCTVKKHLTAVALTVTLTGVLLTGCAQGPSENDYKSACEAKVSAGVTHWWVDQYGEAPWDVVDVTSMSAKEGTESTSSNPVFYVSGSASVQPTAKKVTEPIRWSCFSQAPNGEVFAAIRSVAAQ